MTRVTVVLENTQLVYTTSESLADEEARFRDWMSSNRAVFGVPQTTPPGITLVNLSKVHAVKIEEVGS